jgi:hypothetical protein
MMMTILPLILLLILLAVAIYFLRAASAAADAGRPVGGMGEDAVTRQAKQDKAKAEESKSD